MHTKYNYEMSFEPLTTRKESNVLHN